MTFIIRYLLAAIRLIKHLMAKLCSLFQRRKRENRKSCYFQRKISLTTSPSCSLWPFYGGLLAFVYSVKDDRSREYLFD